jgi:hypothetical protein
MRPPARALLLRLRSGAAPLAAPARPDRVDMVTSCTNTTYSLDNALASATPRSSSASRSRARHARRPTAVSVAIRAKPVAGRSGTGGGRRVRRNFPRKPPYRSRLRTGKRRRARPLRSLLSPHRPAAPPPALLHPSATPRAGTPLRVKSIEAGATLENARRVRPNRPRKSIIPNELETGQPCLARRILPPVCQPLPSPATPSPGPPDLPPAASHPARNRSNTSGYKMRYARLRLAVAVGEPDPRSLRPRATQRADAIRDGLDRGAPAENVAGAPPL